MIAPLIVRFFQLLFGVVVLGLSVTAIKWQVFGGLPPTTVFGAVCGAFGMLASIIGAAVIFVEAVPDIIMAAVDVLAGVLFLAGGIAFAVGLKGVSCSDELVLDTYTNNLLTGGCTGKGKNEYCGFFDYKDLQGRCKKMEADTAFLFLGFIASAAAAALCFVSSKRGGGRHSAV